MTDKTKFYWIKLPEMFFDKPEIKLLKNGKTGDSYVVFYLQLLIFSLKQEGRLQISENIPLDSKMLSITLNRTEKFVKDALEYMIQLGLVEVDANDCYCLPNLIEMTGKETYAAERKREYRAKQKKMLNCDIVPQEKDDVPPYREEIEKNKKEIEEKENMEGLFELTWTIFEKKYCSNYPKEKFNKYDAYESWSERVSAVMWMYDCDVSFASNVIGEAVIEYLDGYKEKFGNNYSKVYSFSTLMKDKFDNYIGPKIKAIVSSNQNGRQ